MSGVAVCRVIGVHDLVIRVKAIDDAQPLYRVCEEQSGTELETQTIEQMR